MVRIDTLLNIVTYCIALLGFSSVAFHISTYVAASFAIAFLLSIYVQYIRIFKIPDLVLTIISILIIILSVLRVRPDDFVMPSIEALTLLLSIKLMAGRRFRDFMQIYAMSLLLLAGSTLVDIRVIFIIYFLVMMLLLNAAIVLLAYHSQSQSIQLEYATAITILHKTAYIAAIAIPLTGLFFFVLPRSTYPLLTFLNIGKSSQSGFSDVVQLGDVTDIQMNTEVVFRAHVDKMRDEDLYWRGVVMDFFDGKAWRSTERPMELSRSKNDKQTVLQTIYLEPTDHRYLFALDRPVQIQREHPFQVAHLRYRSQTAFGGKIRYTAHSVPSRAHPGELLLWEKYLQLPGNLSPQVTDLVNKLIADKNPEDQPQYLADYFRRAKYRYALQGLPRTDNPIEAFLTKYKYGNCEYFASALAIMLRIAGIPSRVVGGYRGGSYNDIGQYYVVTQSEAHLWVEAFVPGTGWLRFDPTPALRTLPTYYQIQEILKKLGLLLDTVNYYWNMVVINYSLNDQLQIISRMTQQVKDFEFHFDRFRLLVLSSIPILIMLTVYLFRTRHARRVPPAVKLVREFNAIMQKRGYPRGPHEGLEEFLAKVTDTELRDKAKRFVERFEAIFYRDQPLRKAEVKTLQSHLRDL